jgi:hypothetical protein
VLAADALCERWSRRALAMSGEILSKHMATFFALVAEAAQSAKPFCWAGSAVVAHAATACGVEAVFVHCRNFSACS